MGLPLIGNLLPQMETQMSNQTNGEAQRLTADDPVPAETLQAFSQIRTAQSDLGLQLLDLEDQKIRILAANKKLREQRDRLFHAVLMERGLSPHTPVEIDGKTGRITVRKAPEPAPAEEPS